MAQNRVSDHILKRVYWLLGLALLLGLAVIVQVVRLQATQADDLQAAAKHQHVRFQEVQANRGSILADDGSLLAVTLPFYQFAMDLTVVDERDFENLPDSLARLAQLLSQHFGEEDETPEHFMQLFREARETQDRHIYLFSPRRRFSYQDFKLIKTFPVLNRGRFEGGFLANKVYNKRFYPMGSLAKITLGTLRDDTTGARGIEYSFNALLRGRNGQRIVQRLNDGVEVPLDYFNEVPTRDGYDIRSTLNVDIQDIAYNRLREAVEANQAKRGVAIVMDVQTGHIKALANYPENFNYGVAEQAEPGSTFKIASVMAALEDGILEATDSIHTGEEGFVSYFDEEIMRDERAFGSITLHEAIERSSNIAISQVIFNYYRGTPKKFIERLNEVGILAPTNFQLKGQPTPYCIQPGDPLWSGVALPWLSIGYNVKLTPLQTLTFYNGIANGGRMLQPLLVSGIYNGNKLWREYLPQEIREQMCSQQTLQAVQAMLRGVVEHGTGKDLNIPGLPLAGKSGTAKKLENGRYTRKYQASFVGYFPADKPRYSCIVMIDEPTADFYYGAKVAGPVFRDIAEQVMSTLQDEHLRPYEFAEERRYPGSALTLQHPARQFLNAFGVPTPARPQVEYVTASPETENVRFYERRISTGTVPDVKGMSARSALALLENLQLQVQLVGRGRVKAQSLAPNARFRPGERIVLTLREAT